MGFTFLKTNGKSLFNLILIDFGGGSMWKICILTETCTYNYHQRQHRTQWPNLTHNLPELAVWTIIFDNGSHDHPWGRELKSITSEPRRLIMRRKKGCCPPSGMPAQKHLVLKGSENLCPRKTLSITIHSRIIPKSHMLSTEEPRKLCIAVQYNAVWPLKAMKNCIYNREESWK